METKKITLEEILPSIKRSIANMKSKEHDKIVSIDTLTDDRRLSDIEGGIVDIDVVEIVMDIEEDLAIQIDDKKAWELYIQKDASEFTISIKEFAESLLAIIIEK